MKTDILETKYKRECRERAERIEAGYIRLRRTHKRASNHAIMCHLADENGITIQGVYKILRKRNAILPKPQTTNTQQL